MLLSFCDLAGEFRRSFISVQLHGKLGRSNHSDTGEDATTSDTAEDAFTMQ